MPFTGSASHCVDLFLTHFILSDINKYLLGCLLGTTLVRWLEGEGRDPGELLAAIKFTVKQCFTGIGSVIAEE